MVVCYISYRDLHSGICTSHCIPCHCCLRENNRKKNKVRLINDITMLLLLNSLIIYLIEICHIPRSIYACN